MATMSSTMSTEYAMRDIGQAENLGDITAGRSVYQTHIGTLIQNFLAGEFSGNIPNATERSWVSCTGRSMNRLSKRADAPDSQASVDETNVYRQGPPTAQESESPSSIVHPPTASQSTYPTPGETQNSPTRHSTSPAAPSIHQRPVVEPNYLSRQLHELPQLLPRSHPRDLWRSPVGDSRRWYRYSPKQRLFKARLEGPSSRTITLIHVLLFYQKHAEHIASGFMKGHKKTPYEPTSIDQNFVDKVYEINWKPLELKEKGRKKRTEEQDPDFLYKSLKQYHEKLAVVFFDVNEPGDFETVLKVNNVYMMVIRDVD
jgi:hypothetical protein